jgi:divalent metal cation (Fe/Co/Zn/Cd) transporter
VHVEAHITLDGDLPLGEAHERASQLERECRARIPHLAELVTHIEPSGLAHEPFLSRLSREDVSRAVQEALDRLPGCGPYHKVRVYSEGEDWSVSLHCLLDSALSLRQAHEASSAIENQLRNQVPRLCQVTVHVEPLPGPAD